MAEIVFNHWLVVSQLTAPYQCIWQGTITDGFEFITIKYIIDPIQVFTIVNVGYFCSVDVE